MKILSFIITLLISVNLHAQIKLPKGFRCVYGENHIDESFFTDGTYFFSSYPWGRSGLYGREVIEAIEKNHNNKLKFKPTKDGLYWATGKSGTEYYYIIVDNAFQYTLHSEMNGTQFSNYSSWMLQQIRNNLKSEQDNYFTDYLGKSCSGIR